MNYKQMGRRALASSVLLASMSASAITPGTVAITSVSPATDGSDNLVLQGRVDNGQGITSLDINGYVANDFDGLSFSLQMPAADDYQVNLYSADSSQVVNYASANAPVDSAVQVVIGEQLMADLGPALGTLLTDLDLNKVLGIGGDQCVVDTRWLIGCDFYIKQLAIQGEPDIQMSFSPDNGERLTVNLAVQIPSAVMQTKIKRAWWWGYRNTTVTTKNIDLAVQIGVEATANQSIKLVLDDASDIQMSIGSMRVHSNVLAAHLIPLFKDTIAHVVNNHVANVAGPFLAHLPIPAIPLDLALDIDGDGVNDGDFAIRMNAETLDVLGAGDGQAVLAGSISSNIVKPGREIIGTRRVGGALPAAEVVTAPTDVKADLSVDLVNQVLAAVYQSGIEEKIALPMQVKDLGEIGAILPFLGYGLEDQLEIRLSFGAAPDMQVNNDSLYPLGLAVALPQMSMDMVAIRETGDESIMSLIADVLVKTSLAANDDGSLSLEFGDLLALNNNVITGGALSVGVPPEDLAAIISVALPAIVTEYEPLINELLATPRLDLDIGAMLSDWLETEFPSVLVSGYVTEAGVSDDEGHLSVGLGLDFPQ